jgi:hypothetical protein
MYFFFLPALVALVVIGSIMIKDQIGSRPGPTVCEQIKNVPENGIRSGENYVENFSESEELEISFI